MPKIGEAQVYLAARMSWCASYEAHHPTGNKAGASARVVRDVGGARAPSRLRLRLFFWIGNFVDFK